MICPSGKLYWVLYPHLVRINERFAFANPRLPVGPNGYTARKRAATTYKGWRLTSPREATTIKRSAEPLETLSAPPPLRMFYYKHQQCRGTPWEASGRACGRHHWRNFFKIVKCCHGSETCPTCQGVRSRRGLTRPSQSCYLRHKTKQEQRS